MPPLLLPFIAYGLPAPNGRHAQLSRLNSTRRFSARPSAVAFEATGFDSP
jgi:hypothetical protein